MRGRLLRHVALAPASIATFLACSSTDSAPGNPAGSDASVGEASDTVGTNDAGLASDASAAGEAVWRPLSVMAITNPMDFGAIGDGVADDRAALAASVAALPKTGGVVFLPSGKTFRKTEVLYIEKSHVGLWASNREATIFSAVAGVRRKSGVIFRKVTGGGVFGVRFTSDATERFDALEDNQITADGADGFEVFGAEIFGSPASGIFLYGASKNLFVEGNFIHHTYADHIHHTDGTRTSHCWKNFFLNGDPSKGDDGIACVTYCPTCPKCGDMEWWANTHLGGTWGRGYSVIGGDHIHIHHNWAVRVAGASVIVASEPSYDSASSNAITVEQNWLVESGQTIGHAAILVSGENTNAEPIHDVAFSGNVAVGSLHGAYHVEGATENITNQGLSESAADLPGPVPTTADVVLRDTRILRTRDTSFVADGQREGLYRIHVRKSPTGADFEERFEYVVKGAPADVHAFTSARTAAGDVVAGARDVGGASYAVVLASSPIAVSGLTGVPFADLRAGARSGDLAWLFDLLDN